MYAFVSAWAAPARSDGRRAVASGSSPRPTPQRRRLTRAAARLLMAAGKEEDPGAIPGWKNMWCGGWPGGEEALFKWLESGQMDDVPYVEAEKQPRAGGAAPNAPSTGSSGNSSPTANSAPGKGRVVPKLVTNPVTGSMTLEYVPEDEGN
ncbi:hypothetical protein CDCA_CDCA14G3900 [Cyanidium caldarium]|uniref:Uncharacterized protein n=1 Tax=Cyanidium caldarium TaxID=2771 RepID=A0AAV9IZW7_CYACA|nr:hypothetical protein CDCA_CDCA14G3900 [Cyanidium caldarium]